MSEGPGDSEFADRVDDALAGLWRGDADELSRLVDRETLSGSPGLGHILRAVGVDGGSGGELVPGGRLGDYEIVREIGRGGMGIVYEARQQHPDRRVALKVIRGGTSPDELHIRLFEREVQTLARLRHPGIAAIYSAGQADAGLHFFAMELVHGDTLLDYTNAAGDSRTGGPLNIDERLRLFCGICDAVNYAHQRGVIHRDLKPSNILVTDRPGSSASAGSSAFGAELKVLDFGLARITDADMQQTTLITETGRIVGTLAYMSPEQARGDADAIDLRSDVYSLAVILYEMLAGQLPYELSRGMPHQALQTICETPPRRPSTINRALRGDLETIALKALAKDPAHRYQSAAALGDDLRRYLAGQPIVARPPSAVYQLRKLIARHKAPAALLTLLFVSVMAFAAVVTVQNHRVADERDKAVLAREAESAARTEAEQARDAARIETAKAQRIQTFLQDMLASVDPALAQGRDVGVLRDLLADASRRVEHELANEPEVAAAVQSTVGRTHVGLGLYAEARPHLEAVLAFSEAEYGADDLRLAVALDDMGLLHLRSADFASAEPFMQQALDIRARVLGEEHVDLAVSYANLGQLYGFMNEYDRAEDNLRRAVALRRTQLGPDDILTARAVGHLAWLLSRREKLDGAETLHRETVEMLTRILGQEHPDTAMATANLASTVKKLGRPQEAEEIHARAVAIQRRVLGEDHPVLAESLVQHADLLKRLGRPAEAEPLLEDALQIWETHLGKENDLYASAVGHLASVKNAQGDYQAAAALYREALNIYRTVNGDRHLSVAICQSNLGTLLVRSGQYADAETVFRDALALLIDLYGEDYPGVTVIRTNLAKVLSRLGKLDEAEALQREVLAARRKLHGDKHPRVAKVLANLAEVLHARGEHTEAEEDYRKALAIMRETQGETHPLVGMVLCKLGMLLADTNKPAEAAAAYSEAIAILTAAHPEGHPERSECIRQFGRFLLVHDDLVKPEDAESVVRSYRTRVEKNASDNTGLFAAIDSVLGGCLSYAGRYEEAEPLLTDGLPAIREQYGETGMETVRAIQRIIAHYETLGDTATAAEYRQMLPADAE